MAIYDVDAIRESELMEAETDSDSILDNMLEACDSMMGTLAFIDEGARQKYIDMLGDKQDKIKKRMDEVKAMKKAATSDKTTEKYDNELKDLRAKYDALADEASRYSAKVGIHSGMDENSDGMYNDSGAGIGFSDKDSWYERNHNRRDRNSSGDDEKYDKDRNIKDAVKQTKNDKDFNKKSYDRGEYNRYHTGSYRHPYSSYEKGAKANFNKDFGLDKQKEDKIAAKKPGSVLDAQNKKRAIKETCLTILSVLDEI